MNKAAGFLFTQGGTVLLLKRAKDGMWGFPGGHVEEGETELEAATRECVEEMGVCPSGVMQWSAAQPGYTTFCEKLVEPFVPTLNDEHTEFGWFSPDDLPYPTIQGAADAVARLSMNELGVAKFIAEGKFLSPQRYRNVWLFDIRITGTGVAYRNGRGAGQTGEFSFRPPAEWVTDDFLARCNGLPVVMDHPETPILDSDEFANRIVGTVFYPYAKNDEVWGIAKIFDDDTKRLLISEQLSTSPGVLASEDNIVTPLESGETLLYEGAPFLLDHIALCKQGVWDKYGAPTGVETTLIEEQMSEKDEDRREEKKDAEKVETVRNVDDKKDADELADLRAALAEIKSLLKSANLEKSDKKDATEEFVPGEPLKADKKDEEKAEEAPGVKEEKEERERKDAMLDEMRKTLDEVNRRTKELSDEDRDLISQTQARCDSVASLFGESAPRPLQGEQPSDYRRRAAKSFQKHSARWKDIKLAGLSDEVFSVAEGDIYHDSQKAAHAPIPAGEFNQLREVKSRDDAGRVVSRFIGRPSSWMDEFKQ